MTKELLKEKVLNELNLNYSCSPEHEFTFTVKDFPRLFFIIDGDTLGESILHMQKFRSGLIDLDIAAKSYDRLVDCLFENKSLIEKLINKKLTYTFFKRLKRSYDYACQ